MKSSYTNEVKYDDIFKTILTLQKPKHIVEIGILEGYSLNLFSKYTKKCKIQAYDIFDEFNGNGGNKESLLETFKDHEGLTIEYGDFYKLYETMNSSIDIIHIDIANNGDVYEYALKHYLPKLTDNGILLLEGGSTERDEVEWMNKYNKPKINPVLKKYENEYSITVIGNFPSLTIIQKK